MKKNPYEEAKKSSVDDFFQGIFVDCVIYYNYIIYSSVTTTDDNIISIVKQMNDTKEHLEDSNEELKFHAPSVAEVKSVVNILKNILLFSLFFIENVYEKILDSLLIINKKIYEQFDNQLYAKIT